MTFAARDLLDEDGRPVAEVASPHFARTPTELAICPYADAREGGTMNRSALRQMTATWPELLASFSAMAGPNPTVSGAWRAAVTGIALPLLAQRPVSRGTAALFKASLGLSQVFSALLLTADGVADAPLTALGDAAAFFSALDAGRWLVGAEQVCAGTRPMIEAVFEALAGTDPRRGERGSCPVEILRLVDAVGTTPSEIVGLHVAHLTSLQASARRGEAAAPQADHPWLRAVFAVPDRPPGHARRLFPVGETPASIERYLALAERDPASLERAFAVELQRLG